MSGILIPHTDICDLAKLTLLVYEYGKKFEVDNTTTIEQFVSEMVNDDAKKRYSYGCYQGFSKILAPRKSS